MVFYLLSTAFLFCIYTLLEVTLLLPENIIFIITVLSALYLAFFFSSVVLNSFNHTIHVLRFQDSKTTLPNRKYFAKALKNDKQHSLFLILILIDQFQTLKNTTGIEFTDELMSMIGQRLKTVISKGTLLARYSDDTFGLIIKDPNVNEDYLQRVLKVLNLPYKVNNNMLSITASMGVTINEKDNDSDSLLHHANLALNHAKQSGGNHYCYYFPQLKEDAKKVSRIEEHLRKALQENTEFFIQYQPKVRVDTGELAGIEALVRWDSKELGKVGPDVFIPIVESIGLINKLWENVMHQTCQQIVKWKKESDFFVPISINFSAKQFSNPTYLLSKVKEILATYDLPAHSIEIEITESTVLEKESVAILSEFQKIGIKVALDDFGTGYSALHYLKHLPINTLKIDKSFILNIEKNRSNGEIAAMIIDLAHTLNLKVVAEGVEEFHHVTFLQKYRCEEMQGYFIDRPLDHNHIPVSYKQNISTLNAKAF